MCSGHNSKHLPSPTGADNCCAPNKPRHNQRQKELERRGWRRGAGARVCKAKRGLGHNISHKFQCLSKASTSLTAASISSMDGPLMPSSV